MMSQDYTINFIKRLSERPLNARHRSRREVNYQMCNCSKSKSSLSVSAISKNVEKLNDTNYMIEDNDVNDNVADITKTYQNVETTLILSNVSHIMKSAILSAKAHKISPDLNFLHFNPYIYNLSPITWFYLSVIIRILVWLMSWLRCSTNGIDWRLQKSATKSILNYFYVRYLLIFLVVTTSLAQEITHTHQHFPNNGKSLHTFRNNYSSTVMSLPGLKNIPDEITTSPSGKLELDDLYTDGMALPSSNGVSNARIVNLLSRDAILIQQHQRKVLNLHHHHQEQLPLNAIKKSPEFSTNPTCSTCHAIREKAKIDSLESIKVHILSQLQSPPSAEERSKRRDVPKNILDNYYNEYDHNGQRRDHKRRSNQKSQGNFHKHPNLYETVENNEQLEENIKVEKLDYEEKMQSDDPNQFSNENYDDDENDDQLSSYINNIYVFPIANKLRHNRRSEFLTFKFDLNEQTIITGAVLHLYIRGQEWMKEFQPEVMKQIRSNETEPVLFLSVHRALRRTSSFNYTHTVQMTQIRQRIPTGLGKWIQIELKDLPKLWMDQEQYNNLIIVVKTKDDWTRHFIETGRNDAKGGESALTAHIEVRTQLRPSRQKRSVSLDCQESDNELRCCRYPLKVNFTSFGWTFVVAPTDFDAYFCNGECKLGFLPQHPHTHLASLTRSVSPCCSPTKMSSLTLLYFNLEQNLVRSTIPNMTVEKCSCS